jgi:hypothetical protein
VEVDDCVGNPNANSVTDVPDVRVRLDLRIGFGIWPDSSRLFHGGQDRLSENADVGVV